MTPLPGRWLPLTSDDLRVRLHPHRPWIAVAHVPYRTRSLTLRRLDLDTGEWLPLVSAQSVTYLNHEWAGDGLAYALIGRPRNSAERPLVGLLDGEGNGPRCALRLALQGEQMPVWVPFDGDPLDGHVRPESEVNHGPTLLAPTCLFTPHTSGVFGVFSFRRGPRAVTCHSSLHADYREDRETLSVTQVVRAEMMVHLHLEGDGFAQLVLPERHPSWQVRIVSRDLRERMVSLTGASDWGFTFPFLRWTDPDTLILVGNQQKKKRRGHVWRVRASTGEVVRLNDVLGDRFGVTAAALALDGARLALLLADDERRSQRVVVLDLGTEAVAVLGVVPYEVGRAYALTWIAPTAVALLDQAAPEVGGEAPTLSVFATATEAGTVVRYAVPSWEGPITAIDAACGRMLLLVPEEARSRRLRTFLTEPLGGM